MVHHRSAGSLILQATRMAASMRKFWVVMDPLLMETPRGWEPACLNFLSGVGITGVPAIMKESWRNK